MPLGRADQRSIIGEAFVGIKPLIDTASLTADLTAGIEEAAAIASKTPLELLVDTNLNQTELLATIAQALGEIKAAISPVEVPAEVKVDEAGFFAKLVGMKAAAAAFMGGSGFRRAGVGLGLGLGIGIPVATFGSLAGIAGFGLEHYLTILLGLAGSLTAAFGGMGAIAAGAFGTMAVGMGSDLLVMKSTLADTQALEKLYAKLQQDTLVYGKNSKQAAADQAALNAQLKILGSTAGVQAELGLAKQLFALNQFWDKATSQARVQAVNLLTPFVNVAHGFIPLIADAAARNFKIIHDNIGGLVDFLNGPAHVVFADLENLFAEHLPQAVHAFTQGIELLIKTLDFLAPYAGGLVAWFDRILTYLNTPEGFKAFSGELVKLIHTFDTWKDFVIAAVKLIYDVFVNNKGLASALIGDLTTMITKLDAWVKGPGHNELQKLFEVHKQEMEAIINLLPALAPMAKLYIDLAIPLAQIVTFMANFVHLMLSLPGVGPILGYAGAFYFLSTKIGPLGFLLGGVTGLIGDFVGAMVKGIPIATAFDAAVDANAIALFALAIAGAVVGVYELEANWDGLRKQFGPLFDGFISLLGPIGTMLYGLHELIANWRNFIDMLANAPLIGGWFKDYAKSLDDAAAHQSSATGGMSADLNAMMQTNQTDWASMASAASTGSAGMADTVGANIDGMTGRTTESVTKMHTDVLGQITQLFGKGSETSKALSNSINTNFASMKDKGISDAEQMREGMIANINLLYGQGTDQANALTREVNLAFADMVWDGTKAGAEMVNGLVGGIRNNIYLATAAAAQLAKSTGGALLHGIQVTSPSKLTMAAGRYFSQGLALGILDQVHRAVIAATQLATAVSAPLDGLNAAGPTLGALAGMRSGGGIQITNHIYKPGASANEIANEMGWKLAMAGVTG